MELLKTYLEKWSAENRSLEKGETPIEFYAVNVGFRAIADEEERNYYDNIPTSFSLPKKSVDDLRDVARRLLFESPRFKELVNDLGGTIPASDPTPEKQETENE
jgi:NTE family protein